MTTSPRPRMEVGERDIDPRTTSASASGQASAAASSPPHAANEDPAARGPAAEADHSELRCTICGLRACWTR